MKHIQPVSLGRAQQVLPLTATGKWEWQSRMVAGKPVSCKDGLAPCSHWLPGGFNCILISSTLEWQRHAGSNVSWVIDSTQDSALLSRPPPVCVTGPRTGEDEARAGNPAPRSMQIKVVVNPETTSFRGDKTSAPTRQTLPLAGSMKQLDSGSWQRLCFSRLLASSLRSKGFIISVGLSQATPLL